MIKINRINSSVDYDIKYDIYVDDIKVIDINNDEIKDIYIKPGKHYIKVKSDKFISDSINFNLGDGEIIEFEVYPDYKNNFFSILLTKTLYGKKGIGIKIKSDIYL